MIYISEQKQASPVRIADGACRISPSVPLHACSVVAAAAAEHDKAGDKDPEPVVVKGVAQTVVHSNLPKAFHCEREGSGASAAVPVGHCR